MKVNLSQIMIKILGVVRTKLGSVYAGVDLYSRVYSIVSQETALEKALRALIEDCFIISIRSCLKNSQIIVKLLPMKPRHPSATTVMANNPNSE